MDGELFRLLCRKEFWKGRKLRRSSRLSSFDSSEDVEHGLFRVLLLWFCLGGSFLSGVDTMASSCARMSSWSSNGGGESVGGERVRVF